LSECLIKYGAFDDVAPFASMAKKERVSMGNPADAVWLIAYVGNKLAGFVFQQFHLLRRTKALENVELPLIYSRKKDIEKSAATRLDSVGLTARAEHLPNEMSGGECQRVAIARAIVNHPELILADEPTGNLDSATSAQIMGLLRGLNKQGKTVIMVTHEPELAEYASHHLHMRDGIIDRIDEAGA